MEIKLPVCLDSIKLQGKGGVQYWCYLTEGGSALSSQARPFIEAGCELSFIPISLPSLIDIAGV